MYTESLVYMWSRVFDCASQSTIRNPEERLPRASFLPQSGKYDEMKWVLNGFRIFYARLRVERGITTNRAPCIALQHAANTDTCAMRSARYFADKSNSVHNSIASHDVFYTYIYLYILPPCIQYRHVWNICVHMVASAINTHAAANTAKICAVARVLTHPPPNSMNVRTSCDGEFQLPHGRFASRNSSADRTLAR